MSVDTKFLRELWKGAYFVDNDHFNSIRDEFLWQLKGNCVEAEQEYRRDLRNLKRIGCFQKYFQWKEIPSKYHQRFQKSAGVSDALREAGNTAYKAVDITNAFRGYNLALSFAPNGSEQLGLVYGNRGALFLQVGLPREALRDVEEALKFEGHSEGVRRRLEERKVRCEGLIGEGGGCGKEEDVFSNLFSSREEGGSEGRRFCEETLLRLSSTPSGVLKGAADFVKVVYSAECGRRLVVTRDVPAGSTCVVEEPFVSCLERLLTWDTEHCAFCTRPFLGGIPCPSCTFVQFCDEECLAKALEGGHHLEERVFPYLHSTEALHSTETLLILRILLKVGPSALFQMFLKKDFLETCSKDASNSSSKGRSALELLPGFDETSRTYDSSSYTSVFHLVSHKTPYDFHSLETPQPKLPGEFQCLFLAEVLHETSNFFAGIPPESLESFKTFVVSLILQHSENLQYNILSLCEWYTPNLGSLSLPLWAQKAKSSRKNPTTKCYGAGVFPLVALCNHSCDPNAVFVKNCHLRGAAVITSRRLREGDEILISYKAPFTRMRWEERSTYLLENYKFLCGCYACLRKYSVDSTSPFPIDVAKCPTCWEIPVESFSRLCGKCRAKVERNSGVVGRLEEAQEMIRKEKFRKAYEILREESDFLSAHFAPNYEVFQVTQDLMRRTIVHLIHL